MSQTKRTENSQRLLNTSRLLLVVGLSAVVFVACSSSQNNSNQTPVISGQPRTALPMPPISGKSLNDMGWQLTAGKHDTFSEYKGKVLILDFYATWCEPCRNSVPQLVALQHRYGPKGLEVVGLNVGGPDDLAQVPAFARELGIQYKLATPDDDLSNFLLSDNSDIPQTFVFDRQGQLKRRFIGFGESTGEEITAVVETALR